MKDLKTKFNFSRKNTLPLFALFFLCWHPGFIGSESLTLTTYYPAPYGGYVSLLTTQNTILGRDGGDVVIGNKAGIGIGFAPVPKLFVVGETRIQGNIRISGNSIIGGSSEITGTATQGTTHFGSPFSGSDSAIEHGSNTLYIYGTNGLHGGRSVTILDSLDVADLYVTNIHLIGGGAVCERKTYSTGGSESCSTGKSFVGFRGSGSAHVSGFLPANGTMAGAGTYIVLGEDWSGTFICCKLF